MKTKLTKHPLHVCYPTAPDGTFRIQLSRSGKILLDASGYNRRYDARRSFRHIVDALKASNIVEVMIPVES